MSVDRITKAAAKRDAAIAKAHADFRATVRTVHADGLGVQAIATAAGLTRQRVYQLVEPTDAELEARIADIDRKWDTAVERFADQWRLQSWERVEQARRNSKAKKRARKGLGPLPTIASERRLFAETRMLEAIRSQPDHPVFVDVRRQLADRDALAAKLERRADRRSGIFS